MSESAFENLQQSLWERLRVHRDLVGIEVINRCRRNYATALHQQLREAAGLSVVVLPPVPVAFGKNCPFPTDVAVELRVRVREDLTINTSARSALEIAEKIHHIICSNPLHINELSCSLMPRSNHPWEVQENFPETAHWQIELIFETKLFLHNPKIQNKI